MNTNDEQFQKCVQDACESLKDRAGRDAVNLFVEDLRVQATRMETMAERIVGCQQLHDKLVSAAKDIRWVADQVSEENWADDVFAAEAFNQ